MQKRLRGEMKRDGGEKRGEAYIAISAHSGRDEKGTSVVLKAQAKGIRENSCLSVCNRLKKYKKK